MIDSDFRSKFAIEEVQLDEEEAAKHQIHSVHPHCTGIFFASSFRVDGRPPENVFIAAFVFGAILILIALLGGPFKIFGAEVPRAAGRTARWVAGLAGIILILTGLRGALQPAANGPSPTPTISRTVPVPRVEGGAIAVRCSANPFFVSPGDSSELIIQAISADNTPIGDANVKVEAGGGVFLSSGSLMVVGRTADDGSFRTMWRALTPAAPAYVMSVHVSKPGYASGEGQCTVRTQ